jgi:hypothetical protein
LKSSEIEKEATLEIMAASVAWKPVVSAESKSPAATKGEEAGFDMGFVLLLRGESLRAWRKAWQE